MLRADHILLREQHRTLEHVLKLTDVTRPVVTEQSALGFGIHGHGAAAVAECERAEKMVQEQGDVLSPLTQRRQDERDDIEPIVQILSEPTIANQRWRSRCVAARTRTSTFTAVSAPTGTISCSCSARSRRACRPGETSPISSRNRVPRSASRKSPGRAVLAPVKAPFTWPNSSLSSSPSARAEQLTATKRRSARSEKDGSCGPRAPSRASLTHDQDRRLRGGDARQSLHDLDDGRAASHEAS